MSVDSTTASPSTRLIAPPPPTGISEQAQRMISLPDAMTAPPYPALDDTASWTALARAMDDGLRPFYETALPTADLLEVTPTTTAGVSNYSLRPTHLDSSGSDLPLFIEIHGGGLYLGAGELAWMAAAAHAVERTGITWAPDYRMPPAHPFPAALDDLIAVYRAALETHAPSQIIVSGASGGGNLAAALLLRAKDEGLPMPAGLILLTPEIDLTESGDTFVTNDGIDKILTSLLPVNRLYANGEELTHPYISPLFGDLAGFPPTLLQSGTRDLFLSNTVRMHRALLAAGVTAELHVFEAMPHGGFGGNAPEDEELRAEVRRFEAVHLAAGTEHA